MENQYQMHFIGNNEPSRPIMKKGEKIKISGQPSYQTLEKHNSVPSLIEPRMPNMGNKLGKKKKNKKLSNYKQMSENDFFASSALVRNGDYAMAQSSWQKVEMNYRNNHPSSPAIALSSSGFSSERGNK